ncbi:IS1 family transposase [uncultured Desulfobacter sp.]|uniref:IS1/IS1595 family N-terminal zinc-binding domain-containing protein n=1 Tax=uncultured Desulfobacter sp. TaxID=240139 RepID=UPI003748FB8D
MKQYAEIKCPRCGKDDLMKNGHSKNGAQRYLCKNVKNASNSTIPIMPGVPASKSR